MTRWLAAIVALAVLVSSHVSSHVARERRAQDRAIVDDKWDEYADARLASGRYVDIGVVLRTVVQDEGILGLELLPGKPRVRVLRERALGGIIDRKRGEIVATSRAPQIWYCSEDQEPVILHDDSLPLGLLVYGSEGAGKTTALAMWHYCRWLEHLGEKREGGQTAPTRDRLEALRVEMFRLFPASWYRHYKSSGIVRLCDGTRIRFRSTKRQSKEGGEAIQTFTWSWCGRDEIQDQIEAHGGIESRGRGARAGRYKQLGTATAKDSTDWRTFRDLLTKGKDWIRLTLLGPNSPFVFRVFWETKKRTMSAREFKRRVLAQDVPPDLAVYYAWERERNLVAYPRLVVDVTAAVLSGYQSFMRPGARFSLLAGHDPGAIYNTTTFWRMLVIAGLPTWVCVGEVVTKQSTAREHARKLAMYVREKFGIERGGSSSKVAIFADPHGKGTAQTDYQAVYMAFQKEGLDVFSPAPNGGRINRAPRVELVNRLMRGADDTARMVIATDEYGAPVAPELVASFESLEKRPGDDNPEGGGPKDERDRTHAPASAGYALWMFEQEAYTEQTEQVALAEARRIFA